MLAPNTETLSMNRNGGGAREEFGCFVGVDLHKTTVTLVAVDGGGEEVVALKCSTRSTDRIAGWLAELARPRWLAVEAVGFVVSITLMTRGSVTSGAQAPLGRPRQGRVSPTRRRGGKGRKLR